MTERVFKSIMKKIPAGEYRVSDMWSIYEMICPKTYKDTTTWENKMRFQQFCIMFDQYKYAFEHMFNGKIRYIGTNDLDFFVVD